MHDKSIDFCLLQRLMEHIVHIAKCLAAQTTFTICSAVYESIIVEILHQRGCKFLQDEFANTWYNMIVNVALVGNIG